MAILTPPISLCRRRRRRQQQNVRLQLNGSSLSSSLSSTSKSTQTHHSNIIITKQQQQQPFLSSLFSLSSPQSSSSLSLSSSLSSSYISLSSASIKSSSSLYNSRHPYGAKCQSLQQQHRHRQLSILSMVNKIVITIIISLSLNLYMSHFYQHSNLIVYSWNWDHNISEELLDRFICLRAKGFFPHEQRCDHFYECRNATIVNEGICRPGLRFDYRYRKKPRCIPLDQIDCRITQIDYQNEFTNNNNNDDYPEPKFIGNHRITESSSTTTMATTTTTPTPTTTTNLPPLLNIHRQIHHNQIPSSSTTSSNHHHYHHHHNHRSLPSSPQYGHFNSMTTATHFTPSSSPISRPISTIMTTSAITAPAAAETTTTSPISTQPTTTTTESPISKSSFQNNEQNFNRHNHHQRATSSNVDTTMSHSNNNDNNDDENFLNKKRKLLKKPLKLRRQRLQQDEIDDSNSLSATISGTINNNNNNNNSHHHRQHQQLQTPPPRLTEQILTRAISSLNYDQNPSQPRQKSIHCPHPNGYYPDRDDCRKFYACDDGRAFLMSCPLGLAYDEMTGTCSWPDMVEGCRSEEMLRFNCPEPNENEILDYGDPRYPTSDCRKFVVCIQSEIHGARTPRLLGCEEGLVFNPDSRECDYPENVPICSNYYDGHKFSRNLSRSIHSSRKRKNRYLNH
ncbi:uncharacterized protein LOC113791869 [Dermatophagoides pteronyssinus]|uniref:uncharacterized protein LOC113791869 n=1 Tax=Dermatophagoides pteronyssinus TaxID=6956 RepID=UPI003F6688C4